MHVFRESPSVFRDRTAAWTAEAVKSLRTFRSASCDNPEGLCVRLSKRAEGYLPLPPTTSEVRKVVHQTAGPPARIALGMDRQAAAASIASVSN